MNGDDLPQWTFSLNFTTQNVKYKYIYAYHQKICTYIAHSAISLLFEVSRLQCTHVDEQIRPKQENFQIFQTFPTKISANAVENCSRSFLSSFLYCLRSIASNHFLLQKESGNRKQWAANGSNQRQFDQIKCLSKCNNRLFWWENKQQTKKRRERLSRFGVHLNVVTKPNLQKRPNGPTDWATLWVSQCFGSYACARWNWFIPDCFIR